MRKKSWFRLNVAQPTLAKPSSASKCHHNRTGPIPSRLFCMQGCGCMTFLSLGVLRESMHSHELFKTFAAKKKVGRFGLISVFSFFFRNSSFHRRRGQNWVQSPSFQEKVFFFDLLLSPVRNPLRISQPIILGIPIIPPGMPMTMPIPVYGGRGGSMGIFIMGHIILKNRLF